MPYPARQKGFTLIELLITMSIAAFLMVSGSIAITDSRKNQSLRKAQQQLKLGIEQAKHDAFFGKKPSGCDDNSFSGNYLYTYQNTPPTSPSTYEITADCSSEVDIQELEFGTDIKVTPTRYIIFRSVTGGVVEKNVDGDLVPISGNIEYKVELVSDSSRYKTVTVTPSGGIHASE